MRRRPDVRQAEALYHAAVAQIGVATAELYPTFNLAGSGQFAGTHLHEWFDWHTRQWSFGPAMNWAFFNSGANLWNIQVQESLAQQACLTYEQAVLTALSDVENALVASANEFEHRKQLEAAVAANIKAVDYATKLYEQGQTDFLNVLDAQRSLLSSQDALVQSIAAISTDLVSLYKAVGGGWSIQTPVGPTTQAADVPFGAILNQVSGGKLAK